MREPSLPQPSPLRRLLGAAAREAAEVWTSLRRVYDDAFVETSGGDGPLARVADRLGLRRRRPDDD